MKKLLLIIIIALLFSLFSCSYDFYPYVTFEEATEHITEKYGEPYLIRDTVFYDDGTVRNRLVFWEIDPPEVEEYVYVDNAGREYLRTREYTSYYVEMWHQPSDDRNVIIRYRQHGWEILRETKGNYTPVE